MSHAHSAACAQTRRNTLGFILQLQGTARTEEAMESFQQGAEYVSGIMLYASSLRAQTIQALSFCCALIGAMHKKQMGNRRRANLKVLGGLVPVALYRIGLETECLPPPNQTNEQRQIKRLNVASFDF